MFRCHYDVMFHHVYISGWTEPHRFSMQLSDLYSAVLFLSSIANIANMRWRGSATGRALDFAISTSRVQILLEATLRNNLGQEVVYTYVPVSPSSITWYRPKGGDALRLGR